MNAAEGIRGSEDCELRRMPRMYFDAEDNMSNENNNEGNAGNDESDVRDDSIFGPENDIMVSPSCSSRSNKNIEL